MVKTRALLLASAGILALGFIAAPVSLDANGFGFETAAAAGKGGGKDDCATGLGNPGNKKPVGRAGEQPPRGEGEGFNAPEEGGTGVRGRSD